VEANLGKTKRARKDNVKHCKYIIASKISAESLVNEDQDQEEHNTIKS